MALSQNMGPFSPSNFIGSGIVNGIPVYNHQLPITVGGVMGTVQDNAPAKFGRLVSINPAAPDTFIVGHPSGSYAVGILAQDPQIGENNPGMNDQYYEGQNATVLIFGMLQLMSWDTATSGKPGIGMKVLVNKVTGELSFMPRASTAPANYEEIAASIVSKQGPNGATVFINSPLVVPTTSEAIPQLPSPTLNPGPGAVINGTNVYVDMNALPSNVAIYFTADGTVPTTSSNRYGPTGGIDVSTSGTTIKLLATAAGWTNSPVASYTYTIL